MEIILNNQLKSISENSTLQQLLNDIIGEKQKGIAIAVNNIIIPKKDWSVYYLKNQDNVLIIKATQGG